MQESTVSFKHLAANPPQRRGTARHIMDRPKGAEVRIIETACRVTPHGEMVFQDYPVIMNPSKFNTPLLAGYGSAALLLALLTGCSTTTTFDGSPTANVTPTADTIFVIDGDYDYFPGYNVYYNRDNHQYAYVEDGYWVSRPAPYGVATNVLRASPSVRMGFRDSPANHNAEMVLKYPHNWVPPGAKKQLPVPAPDKSAGNDHT